MANEITNEITKIQVGTIPYNVKDATAFHSGDDISARSITVSQDLKGKNLDLTYIKADGSEANGKVKSHLVPYYDNTYDLGSTSKCWNDLFVENIKSCSGIKFQDGSSFKADQWSRGQASANLSADAFSALSGKSSFKVGSEKIEYYYYSDTNLPSHFEVSWNLKFDNNNGNVLDFDGADGKLSIGPDNTNLTNIDQINLIPGVGAYDNLSVQTKDRIKIGGKEIVEASNTRDIIFAFKPANSADKVVPFAIATDGDTYYKGRPLDDFLLIGDNGELDLEYTYDCDSIIVTDLKNNRGIGNRILLDYRNEDSEHSTIELNSHTIDLNTTTYVDAGRSANLKLTAGLTPTIKFNDYDVRTAADTKIDTTNKKIQIGSNNVTFALSGNNLTITFN